MNLKNAVLLVTLFTFSNILAQFGQNRVQYVKYNWRYIETKHFNIYFSSKAKKTVEFLAREAEAALNQIQRDLHYKIDKRIIIILYNSHNEFQETNTSDQFIGQGIGGFTESFKNRVVIPFEGSFAKFRHVIHHELVHAVMNEYLFGGNLQSMISRGIKLQLPLWFNEGLAEYLSSGWETNSDQFIRDAIINEYLPDINRLGGYFAYRGGQSLFKYISDTYGRDKIAELVSKIKGSGSFNSGLKKTLNINLDELNEHWKKALKKAYWPEIAYREDPSEFAKELTNTKKSFGFYNTSPAISPQGDKIAFISDRDIFLDVYVMDADNPKKVKKVVESGQENDFEELNVLFPSIAWAPDNIRIALAGKSNGFDNITIINTQTDDYTELPFQMNGISSVSWSPDGNKIAFVGQNGFQSDIYIYNLKTKKITNLTDDIFSDSEPSWSPDSKKIFFSSDRGNYLNKNEIPENFDIFKHNFKQLDIYSIEISTKKIERLTNWKLSSERNAQISPDGKYMIFVSDKNGIFNIYKKRIFLLPGDTVNSVAELPAFPLTNSLNGIDQISIDKDANKLVFSSLFDKGYNLFLLTEPFKLKPVKKLKNTRFMASLLNPSKYRKQLFRDSSAIRTIDSITEAKDTLKDSTNKKIEIFAGNYIEKSTESDSTKGDYTHYIFGRNLRKDSLSIAERRKRLFKPLLDKNGNYLVKKYKVDFSPDIVYANAGYSTLYGLLGTTVLAFSDVLGNHRLIGITSMQLDLKNSDYGLSYYYLASRTDWSFQAFHTARFLYVGNNFFSDLYRFRNYGLVVSASYPFNRFYRLDGSLGWFNVTAENLDNINVPTEKRHYLIPSFSFVHDNTFWGYTSPIQGTRYNFTFFGNPGFFNKEMSFYSFTWDYRKYFRFFFDNSFVIRFSGGISGGANPQHFFVGGVDYWINRNFATGNVPITNASDFAFLTPGLPLRGYDYAQQIGTRYSLLNLELRFPFIRYLVTGPLPISFQNILGVAFIDAGSAWNDFKSLKFITTEQNGKVVTQDLLMGMGFGLRFYFAFLWRVDVAWSYDLQKFSVPKYYISMGLDF